MATLLKSYDSIFKVQKKLAYSISIASFFVSIINFITLYSLYGLEKAFYHQSVLIVLAISILMLITSLPNKEIVRLFQLSVIGFTAALAIIDDHNSIHGLGLLFIAAFIAFKYGYFKRHLKLKAITSLILTAALMEYSAVQKIPEGKYVLAIDAIIYIILFFFVTYLIYSDEITYYIESNKEKEGTIDALEQERDLLLNRVKSLDKKIARIIPNSEPLDMEQYKITPAELRVIEILVLYRATDRDIADRLCISYHTVKNHFRSIRNKMGVDRRDEIIDLCRFNFLE